MGFAGAGVRLRERDLVIMGDVGGMGDRDRDRVREEFEGITRAVIVLAGASCEFCGVAAIKLTAGRMGTASGIAGGSNDTGSVPERL